MLYRLIDESEDNVYGGSLRQIVVQGNRPLLGSVRVVGAKNSALKVMAASLLTEEPVILTNVPAIRDVEVMSEVLRGLGRSVERQKDRLEITGGTLGHEAPFDQVSKMRASIIVLGPLVARLGRASVAMPGGCNIGMRKIDLHIRGLEKLGVRIDVDQASIEARADRLIGTRVPLDFPSVGATENIMMAATLAKGTTVIENAAREPEIVDLAQCLNQMGAHISGAGSSDLVIEGVDRLFGVEFPVTPDRIEASTFMVAAAATGGDVTVSSVRPEHLGMIIKKLRQSGCEVTVGAEDINVKGRSLEAINISTLPYPGFPTDMQAPFMALLSTAAGKSVITENVFENRFSFVQELTKLGADIEVSDHHAVIQGDRQFHGGKVKAPDLRAGAGLVIAGLAAHGDVEISDIHHIERGYEDLTGRLRSLGAEIEVVDDGTVVKMEAVAPTSEVPVSEVSDTKARLS